MRDLRIAGPNSIELHLLDHGGTGPLVVLAHGFMEHAHVWDFVAPHLASAGFHPVALDWRGHGDSDRVGAGGYYHFADYIADLAFVVRALGEPAVLVGHSMGGNACLLYAGTEPGRVAALVNIEGLGPPDSTPATAPERFAGWIDDLTGDMLRDHAQRTLSLAAAERRLARNFPLWPAEAVRHMALHGTRPSGRERCWKVDPLHRTRSPQPFYAAQATHFWQRVDCPVLYLEGGRSLLSAAALDIDHRVAALTAERVRLADSGHHPHLEHPEATARAILGFVQRVLPRAGATKGSPLQGSP